jgi:hypothetical protein
MNGCTRDVRVVNDVACLMSSLSKSFFGRNLVIRKLHKKWSCKQESPGNKDIMGSVKNFPALFVLLYFALFVAK